MRVEIAVESGQKFYEVAARPGQTIEDTVGTALRYAKRDLAFYSIAVVMRVYLNQQDKQDATTMAEYKSFAPTAKLPSWLKSKRLSSIEFYLELKSKRA